VKVGAYVVCRDKPCGKLVHGFYVGVHPYTRRTALPVPAAKYALFLRRQGQALQRLHAHPHPRVSKLVASIDPSEETADDGYLFFPPLYGDLTSSRTSSQPPLETRSLAGASGVAPVTATARGGEEGLAALFKRMLESVGHCHDSGIAVGGVAPASFGWSDERCTQVVLSGLGEAEVVCARGEQRRIRAAAAAAALQNPTEAELLGFGGSRRGSGGSARIAAATAMARFLRTAAATAFARDIVGLAEVFHFLLRQAGYDSPQSRPVPNWALALLRQMLETNPVKQLTAAELAEADWFQWAAEATVAAEVAAVAEAEAASAHVRATALITSSRVVATAGSAGGAGARRRRRRRGATTSGGHEAALEELAALVASSNGGRLPSVLDDLDLESGDDDQRVPTFVEEEELFAHAPTTATVSGGSIFATAEAPASPQSNRATASYPRAHGRLVKRSRSCDGPESHLAQRVRSG